MAFTSITSTEIATGKPTTNDTWTTVKDNLDDHESRVIALEGGSAVTYPPIILRFNGNMSFLGATTNLIKTVTNFALTVTGVRVYVDVAGSSGTLTCDIKKSHSGGAYTSILTTLPSVAYGAGNDAVSTNAVLDSSKVDIAAGDILRLDTTTSQTDGFNFWVRIDYNKT
jgi:hypothetical protein